MFTLQAMMHAQKEGNLKDGWFLLSRLHLILSNASKFKNDWENKKSNIGFSNYTYDEYKNISNNDWLLIAMSYAA